MDRFIPVTLHPGDPVSCPFDDTNLKVWIQKNSWETLLQNKRVWDSLFVPNNEGVALFLHSHHPSALTSLYKPRSTKKCGD